MATDSTASLTTVSTHLPRGIARAVHSAAARAGRIAGWVVTANIAPALHPSHARETQRSFSTAFSNPRETGTARAAAKKNEIAPPTQKNTTTGTVNVATMPASATHVASLREPPARRPAQ